MSFLKIKDPLKREQTVKEYLATVKRIRDNQLAEKTGDIELQTDLSKFFRPITETQKASTKEITEGLKPIKEGIEQLPKEFPQPASLFPKEEEEEEYVGKSLLDEKYRDLKEEYEDKIDKTFGIIRKDINYYIGNKMIDYDGEYIWVGADKFLSTDGLWELIMSKTPSVDYNLTTSSDFKNYEKILRNTNVIFRDNDPTKPPKSSGGLKYSDFIKPIYLKIIEERARAKAATGEGITVIPSDPNALLERFDLLMASKGAGHTGVRNELVSICDELKRQRVLDTKTYKKLMSII